MKTLIQIMTISLTLSLIAASVTSAQPNPAPTSGTVTTGTTGTTIRTTRGSRAKKLTSYPFVQATEQPQTVFTGTRAPGSVTGSVMVIPISEMKTEDLVQITEDMTVMGRIFDQQLRQDNQDISFQKVFLGDAFKQSSRISETMYLQGYGALFLRKVNFPLTPPPDDQEQDKKTEKENTDQVWEQTRQQIYQPQIRLSSDSQEVKYDAQKVENLKTTLIQSLKHASNIRALKPDESVILTITGSGIP